MAIIALVGLPIFGWILFPILYFVIHDYVDYLTGSNVYNIQKINVDDFNDFEPDVTVSSFQPITDEELLRYPQVRESVEYFEGKRDAADLNTQVYCNGGECTTFLRILRVENTEFMQTFGFDRCFSLFEHNRNYYQMNCIIPYDPPPYYFDAFSYSILIILIGTPTIIVAWIFHRWHVQGREKMAQQSNDG